MATVGPVRALGTSAAEATKFDVGMLTEGEPLAGAQSPEVLEVAETLQRDAVALIEHISDSSDTPPEEKPSLVELSVVLCDDTYIAALNAEWRGKAAPTDVLSFEMGDDDDDDIVLPFVTLGDVVISLDTAAAQAKARDASLLEECRVLLVHGVLHLLGYDHELGEEEEREMAQEEVRLMKAMQWEGEGLISNVKASAEEGDGASVHGVTKVEEGSPSPTSSSASESSTLTSASMLMGGGARTDIKLVAIDMDGTLLDKSSRIPPGNADAIRAAIASGVRVILATGKARPAAIAACEAVGLAGDDLLVSTRTAGIFLQGLAVHAPDGSTLAGASLPRPVVADVIDYCSRLGTSLCVFQGDTCGTLECTADLVALHETYYEPLAAEYASKDALLDAMPARKLLLMADPSHVAGVLRPHWEEQLAGAEASCMQAVPNMLEIVPRGINKWVGMELLMDSMGLQRHQVMAIGDGENDLELVAGAGLGVAMGNAVPAVKEAALAVVADNGNEGVAEALERFIL